jgi:hypothetical protein
MGRGLALVTSLEFPNGDPSFCLLWCPVELIILNQFKWKTQACSRDMTSIQRIGEIRPSQACSQFPAPTPVLSYRFVDVDVNK